MAKGNIHKIVSNVDTIIILRNPSIQFADWTSVIRIKTSPKGKKTKKGYKERKRENKLPLIWNFPDESNDAPRLDSKQPSIVSIDQVETTDSIKPSIFGELVSSAKPHIATPNDPGRGEGCASNGIVYVKRAQAEVVPIEEEETRYHVCSGNLMSASPWFNRAMDTVGWSESQRNKEDGYFYVYARDWDEEAFTIILRIFHLQNDMVPEVVSLEMLAKISVIVHYYECASAVRMHFNIWISNLKKSSVMPSTYCRDLVLWICIAKVFSLHEEFRDMTRVAIKHCDEGEIRTMELPIVGPVAVEIEMRRLKSIRTIIAELHGLLDRFRSSNYQCPDNTSYAFECGSILYGALTKGMHLIGFWPPYPLEPFAGLSLHDVRIKAKLMKSPAWRTCDSNYKHSCRLDSQVSKVVDRVWEEATGLDLHDYQEKVRKGNEM